MLNFCNSLLRNALIYQFHFSGCAKCLLCFKWWKLNFGGNAKWLLENCGHWNYADNWWKSWFEWFHQWHTGRTFNDVFLCGSMCTGESFSEALILESVNPQYDKRLFIEFPETYKFTTCCVKKKNFVFVLTFKTILVHNMLWTCIISCHIVG